MKKNRYICIGPYAWGRAKSVKEAQRICVSNIGVKLKGSPVQHCVVYEVFSDEVRISGIDGSLDWPSDDLSPIVVWMGSEFSCRNPGLSVGQSVDLAPRGRP